MDQKEMMRYAGLPKLKEFPEEEILDTIREMTAIAEPGEYGRFFLMIRCSRRL